jgi:serine/threonine protein kinase
MANAAPLAVADRPADPATRSFVNQMVAGYHLGEQLGMGGHCRIFRGRGPGGVERAIKIIKDDLVDGSSARLALERERRALAALARIPGLPRLLGSGVLRGQPALILELLPGRALHLALVGLAPARRHEIFVAAVSLVARVHAAGWIHGDLKPENLLLADDGSLSLVDFGNALPRSRPWWSRFWPQRRQIIAGSPTYLSPERIQGHPPSAAADVYALGICGHVILTGQPPFAHEDTRARMRAAVREGARSITTRISRLPKAAAGAIDQSLDRDPSRRPADAGELLTLLHARQA